MLNTDLYSVDFFDLQLRFAAKVAELSGLPFTETVGSHTNIYVRLGMGPRLDHTNPDWLDYISALATARNPTAWTYEVHRRRAHLPTGPEVAASVGCFSYAHFGPNRVLFTFTLGLSFRNHHFQLRTRVCAEGNSPRFFHKLRRWAATYRWSGLLGCTT